MERFKLQHKIVAIILILVFSFQSLHQINSHTYTIGFENFHYKCPDGITCCFGIPLSHSSYNCGKTFHLFY